MNETLGQLPTLMIPPHNVEAEQAVLGGIMLAPEALSDLNLAESDFYRRDHALIFKAIQQLAEHGKPFDAVTLGDWLEQQGQSETVAHGAYLVELASTTPSAANISAYAEIVRTAATKRQLIELGTDMVNRGFNCAEPADIIADGMTSLANAASRVSTPAQEPLDLFGDQPHPRLTRDLLPPGIAEFAFDHAEVMGTAPEIIAMTAIATIAAATSDAFRLQPRAELPGWKEAPCLWMMVVADPGSKKTPAMEVALKPLLDIDDKLGTEFVKKLSVHTLEKQEAVIRQREQIKRAAKGDAGYDEPVNVPSAPPNERVFIQDATIEAIAPLSVDNPRGLTFYRDELAGWFGGMDAYGSKGTASKDRPKWLEAYQSKSTKIDRKVGGMTWVQNWSLSVVGSIQPDRLKTIIANSEGDDGLFARFIIVDIPNAYRKAQHRVLDDTAYRGYCKTIADIWNRQGGGTVTMSPEADKECRRFCDWVDRVSTTEGLPTMLRGHLSKWSGLWSRLALVYHSYGCARGGMFPSNTELNKNTAIRISKLMERYLLPQAMKFYGETMHNADVVYTIARKAAGLILDRKMGRITNRELHQGINIWRDAPEWKKTGAITMLKEAGWLLASDKRGETSWTVNPRVHALFDERAKIETEKRAQMAAGLKELRDAAAGRDGG